MKLRIYIFDSKVTNITKVYIKYLAIVGTIVLNPHQNLGNALFEIRR
jgi:hypothetical protein